MLFFNTTILYLLRFCKFISLFFSVHLCKKTKFTPCASFWDFAFGDQGASPLEPDRQGAGAEYLRSGKGVSPFPPGGGGSTVDRQAST